MLSELIAKLKQNKELYLKIKIKPNSSQSLITEKLLDDTLKIAVKSPPIRGRANQELKKIIARNFALRQNQIKIINGHKTRTKLIKISS